MTDKMIGTVWPAMIEKCKSNGGCFLHGTPEVSPCMNDWQAWASGSTDVPPQGYGYVGDGTPTITPVIPKSEDSANG